MDSFQITVIAIAVVVLIVILTVIGVMITKSKNKVVYPPVASTCPDYWKVADDGVSCTIPTKSENNVGNIYSGDTLLLNSTNTPGYSSNGVSSTIDFTNAGWSSSSKSSTCSQKDWTGTYNIVWDGISNYNSC